MLFTDFNRTNHHPKRATETDFAFLDRCAWPSVATIREFFELCLAHYPAAEQRDLVIRIQSGDARHFSSAIFELVLYEFLSRCGFGLEIHPQLENGSPTRPDFRVTCPDGQALYLEAVCASDNDGREPAAEAMKEVTLQGLDSASHANFMVAIDSTGNPTTQPSGRQLAAAVLGWLDTLNPDDEIFQTEDGFETLPEFEWRHEGWRVRVRPIPVKPEARGLPRRLIGIRNFGAGWIDGWTPIRDTLKRKSQRYGNLDLPLVVAINMDTFNLDPIDETQALFGQEQFVFTAGAGNAEPRLKRIPNGAWYGPSGPRGRRCSGAWLFNNLLPYTIAQRDQSLYLNPWANNPVTPSFLVMPHATVVDGRIQRHAGRTLRDVFGLTEDWPE